MSRSRRSSVPAAVLLLACGLSAVPAAAADEPWLMPFSAPAAIAAAAPAVEPVSPEKGAVVLLEETEIRFESDGRRTVRFRLVVRITAASAVPVWGEVASEWAPWYQQRPEVRARVIGPGGSEHWLDPATLSEQPVASLDETIYTDRRRLSAPLPAVAVGAVTEEEWVLRDTAPLFPAGIADRYVFGRGVAAARERLVLDVPADMPLAFESEIVPVEPRREEADGRVRWTWELIDQPPRDEWVIDAPGDVITLPSVEYATGRSWAEVGAAYARWVDERVSGFVPPERLAKGLAGAGGRREKIAAALAWLHEEVRYTGLELGDAAIVPAAPAEVLTRKYGDCKDKATLLVAALRQAGIEAEVALLATGPGFDVDPDLPGFGLFDHMIVHLPGEPELWIDATAHHARLGQVPGMDRGRLALVARAEGAELRRVPEATAAENLFRQEQEVRLGDWGDGEILARLAGRGDFELTMRAMQEAAAPDEPLATAEVEEPPATDLSRPFVLAFPPEPSGTFTEGGWASVVVDSSFVFSTLSEALPPAGEERAFDLALPPFTTEIRVDVVPPSGFLPFDPPAAEERQLGALRLTRRVESGDEGRLRLELRLESPRARLTPEEVTATREAVDAVLEEGPIVLRFQSRGQALLDAGKMVEAVAELRRQATSGGAADRVRLALAFADTGLGEAAQREARAAVAADPEAGYAHRTLGYVLVRDELGREYQPGVDLAGAEKALRRAIELDPSDQLARFNLAVLLEHDANGRRYAPGARMDEAIAVLRELRDDLGITDYDLNLLVDLWRAGRYDEVAELAAEETVPASRGFALAALAVREGAAAAVRDASRIADDEERRTELNNAAQVLLVARRYAAAAELISAAAQGTPDAAARMAQAATLAAIVPYESLSMPDDDPRRVVLETLRAFTLDDEAAIERLIAAAEPFGGIPEVDLETWRFEARLLRRGLDREGTNVLTVLDFHSSSVDLQVDGSPREGHRVRVISSDGTRETWYLAADGGRPVVLTEDPLGLVLFGRQALRLLDAGDVAAARRWLDWAREEASPGSLDDPWSAGAITAFWRRGEAADEAACRRAARVLLAAEADEELLAELEAGLAGAASERERLGYELALVAAYFHLERWAAVEELARDRLAASPESISALQTLAVALRQTGRFDEMAAVAEQRLARRADDATALRLLYDAASSRGDTAAALGALERLVAAPDHLPLDFNNLAWARLVAGEADAATLEEAHRGVQGAGLNTYSELHTLAALFAELGRPLEAKDVIVQALEVSGEAEPQGSDWYVLGRIAESYDETEIAVAAYRRVDKPEDAADVPFSTWTLAQRRLAAIAAEDTAPPVAATSRGSTGGWGGKPFALVEVSADSGW